MEHQDNVPAKAEMRISDADRDRVIKQLQDASSEGRITLDEFAERSRMAYDAKFASDLVPLTSDLPVPADARPLTPARPAPAVPAKRRWLVQIMGGGNRTGQWQAGAPLTSVTVMGGQMIDLTDVTAERVQITALTLMGGTEIIVPRGARVDIGGFMLFGGLSDDSIPTGPSNMVVEIRAWGAMGGCEVRSLTDKEIQRRQH